MSAAVSTAAPRLAATGGSTRRRPSPRARWTRAGYNAAAVVVFLASVFPVYWMVQSSFLPTRLVRATTPTFFPGSDFTLRNYDNAMFHIESAPFLPALGNSLKVTFFTLLVTLVLAFLASIAIGRFRFRGRKTFIIAILVVQMIPGEGMMLTYYRMIDGWHLLNSVVGLGLVYVATVLPFTTWTLRGFVAGVPRELEEAATIDGCSRTGAFWRITFPLLAPGLVSTGVFAFIQAWNEFVFALVVMSRPEAMTLPVWLRTFQQVTKATDWGSLMAGSTLVAIPVVIFFLFVQGRMTGGLVAGAVKG